MSAAPLNGPTDLRRELKLLRRGVVAALLIGCAGLALILFHVWVVGACLTAFGGTIWVALALWWRAVTVRAEAA